MSRDLGGKESTPSNISSSFTQNPRDRIMSQGSSYPAGQSIQIPTPKPHTGPFNVKCLFMENAESLIRRIADYLKQQNVRFVEQEPFTLRTMDNHTIWIESVSGSNSLNLVNFTRNFPNNDDLLEILAQ